MNDEQLHTVSQQAITITQDLVRLASESSKPVASSKNSPELEVVAYLQELCTKANVPWTLQEALPGRYNFIAFFPQENAPRLLILAHMDTVSAEGMENPFAATLDNGRIFGRGACDDKGPLATALSTLLALASSNERRYDVTFVGTVDEECSLAGAAHFAKAGGLFDLCIAMEPTGLRVVNAHKGVFRAQITCKGKATHSSTPELGENAILTMVEVIADLQQYATVLKIDRDPDLGEASLAVTQINGGTVINIIPDLCTISVDIRVLPQHTTKDIANAIRSLLGARGTVRKIFAAPAIHSDPGNEHITRLMDTAACEGLANGPTTAAYATDCSKLTSNGPCIVWGPGSIEQAHKTEEFIEVSQIEKGCRILVNFLTKGGSYSP